MFVVFLAIVFFSVSSFSSMETHYNAEGGCDVSIESQQDHSPAAHASTHTGVCFNHCDHSRLFGLTNSLNLDPVEIQDSKLDGYSFSYTFSYHKKLFRPPLS